MEINKLQKMLEELVENKTRKILSSSDELLSFLRFASKNYKQEYTNIISIYAQRPNATAVADFEFWNIRCKRSIHKGETGIRIFAENTTTGTYARMFDVSQTYGGKETDTAVWQYDEKKNGHILSNVFADKSVTATAAGLVQGYTRFFEEDIDILMYDLYNEYQDDKEMKSEDLILLMSLMASIVTSYRLNIELPPAIIKKFTEDFLRFEKVEIKVALIHVIIKAKNILLNIESEITNDREYYNEQPQLSSGKQCYSNRRTELSIQEVGEQYQLHTEPASGRDTDIRYGGNYGTEQQYRADGGGNTDDEVQQTVLRLSETISADEILTNNKHRELPSVKGKNRPGLFGKIFKSDTAVRERVSEDKGNGLQGKFKQGVADKTNGRRDNDESNVGNICSRDAESLNTFEGTTFVGDSIALDGRNFQIVDFDRNLDKITLLDLTFQKAKGFPISNVQVLSYVERELDTHIAIKAEYEEVVPTLSELLNLAQNVESVEHYDNVVEGNASPTLAELLQMDIEQQSTEVLQNTEKFGTSKIDYRIVDEFNQSGGKKAKFEANIRAIELLKQINSRKELASADEQKILAQYTGWGGLAMAFDKNNASWVNEYRILTEVLSPDEYSAAKASTLTSFYTNKVVIDSMWNSIKSFGFERGNILEPACGVGNFYGLIPESIREKANLYGVEIDNISGEIAKQLYQNAHIEIKGYEDTMFSNSFFDVAVGNIPFGDIKVFDTDYNKHNFNIHDYFFAKTIDKVRAGGIIAFVTSKGTMDKKNSHARKYIFERCDLVGAVRLPNTAFKDAGTEVTSDIIILQKREVIRLEQTPYLDIVDIGDGIEINEYFANNQELMLGVMTKESNMYGAENITTLSPFTSDDNLIDLLKTALGRFTAAITDNMHKEKETRSIPATTDIKNYTYGIVNNTLYYRENSIMIEQTFATTKTNKIKDYCELRNCLQSLLYYQTVECDDIELEEPRRRLNELYDAFVQKYGYVSNRSNEITFMADADINLVLALEKCTEDVIDKTSIFTQRTVSPVREITTVSTADDALIVSINKRGFVDFDYMAMLYGKSKDCIANELSEQIFVNPQKASEDDAYSGYEEAQEYLSGDIYEKLRIAKIFAETNQKYKCNVEALTAALPEPIKAGEIEVRLGAPWIENGYYNQFMYELFGTSKWKQETDNGYENHMAISTHYNKISGIFLIKNKRSDSSANVISIYGTKRINAYEIIEESLNLRDVVVKDAVPYVSAKGSDSVKYVINKEETTAARQRQELIRTKFKEWIFYDATRRTSIVQKYNSTFNSIRLRKFDGSKLALEGMTDSIVLYPHQLNAIARIRSGRNSLLAHVVGTGKTYTMIAGAAEQLRIGMATKAMFVVPNHLIAQFSGDIQLLYPQAKVLATTEAEFEKGKRQLFLSKIAMGDANMIVIGHSQFEKITMSAEYCEEQIKSEIDEISYAIQQARGEKGALYTVKQLEKMQNNLKVDLKKLLENSKKDKMLTFEQLGVSSLFVDEAHYFKNCAIFSKMRNVAGINNSRAKKASDMLMKTRYINQIGGIVTFATGTPISNSICECYVMQRYLQNDMLRRKGIRHFDEWAGTFGETKTTFEPAPEGGGYRLRTRFSNFYNLPELMQMFCEVADIQTADMLDLPTPEMTGGKAQVIACEPSDELINFMHSGVERVIAIRNGDVKPSEDNMLKFITDFRKAGLDMRLIDNDMPFDPQGKLATCAERVYGHFTKSTDIKGTQLIFCDTSTYNPERAFDVYREMKALLENKGIPSNKVAFIHEAKNKKQKEELFERVRNGSIRILIGSTQKCGAGTNIQDKLVALHHLDCPYRPSDIEQREGRILRQGNMNESVNIYRYVTKKSFDAYLWNIVEIKQKFISQLMRGQLTGRKCEDLDDVSIGFAEAQAIASGDPRIREKIEIDTEVQKLRMLKAHHLNEQYEIEDEINIRLPRSITKAAITKEKLLADIKMSEETITADFVITIGKLKYIKREEAGTALLQCESMVGKGEKTYVGMYGGFRVALEKAQLWQDTNIVLEGEGTYTTEFTPGGEIGNIVKIENMVKRFEKTLEETEHEIEEKQKSLSALKLQLGKVFAGEDELAQKIARQTKINAELDVGGQKDIIVCDENELGQADVEDMEDEIEEESEEEL